MVVCSPERCSTYSCERTSTPRRKRRASKSGSSSLHSKRCSPNATRKTRTPISTFVSSSSFHSFAVEHVLLLQVTGASVAFQRYDADRDEDFVRYPCDIRLDGYRLIIHLASKAWEDDKKTDKETKFIGYREYLVKGQCLLSSSSIHFLLETHL